MKDCLFCKIIAGEIPSAKVYEDDQVYAFQDISPQAKVHVLVVPKAHVANLHEGMILSDAQLAALLRAVDKVAAQLNLGEGYRLVVNSGDHGRQTVHHLHLHVIGGEQLSEKMA